MEEKIACRICFSGEEDGPLVQPCACRGSSSWVHPQCLEHWRRTSTKVDAAYRCGQCQDEYRDALSIELLRDQLRACRRRFGENDNSTAHCKNTLGLQLLAQGKYDEAAALLRECQEFMRATRGNADETTLIAINNYAGVLFKQGKAYGMRAELFRQAAALRREVLEGFKALRGERDQKTLSSMNSLGECLHALNDTDGEAVSLFRQVLSHSRELLGDRHNLTLVAMGNLG